MVFLQDSGIYLLKKDKKVRHGKLLSRILQKANEWMQPKQPHPFHVTLNQEHTPFFTVVDCRAFPISCHFLPPFSDSPQNG